MKKDKQSDLSFDEFVEYHRRLIQESGSTSKTEVKKFLNFKVVEAFSKRLRQESKKKIYLGNEKAKKLKDIRGKAKMKIKKKKKKFIRPTSLQKKEWKKGIIDFGKKGLEPPPEISTRLKRKIEEKKGVDVKLVVMKQITKTDLSTHHGRLTIPVNQVKSKHDDYFLTEEEERCVSSKEKIDVTVFEPCGYENSEMGFIKWKLKSSFSYALITNWNELLKEITMRRSFSRWTMLFKVWSFRVGVQLWFAIDKIWDAPSSSSS